MARQDVYLGAALEAGTDVLLDPAANDRHPAGTWVTVEVGTGPAALPPGSVTVEWDGSVTLHLPPDLSPGAQTITFSYVLRDDSGCASLPSQVCVGPGCPCTTETCRARAPSQVVNSAPEAFDQVIEVEQDHSLAIGVMGEDPDGDTLWIHDQVLEDAEGAPTVGDLVPGTWGPYSGRYWEYFAPAGWAGATGFFYRVRDREFAQDPVRGLSDWAYIEIQVTASGGGGGGGGGGPAPGDDPFVIPQGTTLPILLSDLLQNDGLSAPWPLLRNRPFYGARWPEHGRLYYSARMADGDELWYYVPDPGFVGTESFAYQVHEGDPHRYVSIEVGQVPAELPQATPDRLVARSGASTLLGRAAMTLNDFGTEPLTVEGASSGLHGFVDDSHITLAYTSDAGFAGLDRFPYELMDGNGAVAQGEVRVLVAPQDDPPPWPSFDFGCSGFECWFRGYESHDETMVERYLWDFGDGTGGEAPAEIHDYGTRAEFIVTLQVEDVSGNRGVYPYLQLPWFLDHWNHDVAGVLADHSAIDPAPVAHLDVECFGRTCWFDPRRSADNLPLSEYVLDFGDGGLPEEVQDRRPIFEHVYPVAEQEYTATVTVVDAAGKSAQTEATFFVSERPVGRDDAATTDEDVPLAVAVLDNDGDPDGDPIRPSSIVSPPAHGTATIQADGSIRYAPEPNWHGTDGFSYRLTDDDEGESLQTAEVVMTVRSVNDPPALVADEATTLEGSPVVITVVANDTDADGDLLAIHSIGNAAHGTAALTQYAEHGQITYTPHPGYFGTDTFSYWIHDGNLAPGQWGYGPATVTVTVEKDNHPPTAWPDAFAASEDRSFGFFSHDLLADDTDPDGDPLTIAAVSEPREGTILANPELTSFGYSPPPDWCGFDLFSYTVSDGYGGTDSADVQVNVACVNDPPQAADDAFDAVKNWPSELSAAEILANDTDVEGHGLAIASVTAAAHGTAELQADGDVLYTPHQGYEGLDFFGYTVRDSPGATGTGEVAITVLPDAHPVARFAYSCAGRVCDFDATTSTDDVGIVGYKWDFPASYTDAVGSTVRWTFDTGGFFQVKLVVTDGAGQKGTKTSFLTVTEPPPEATDDSLSRYHGYPLQISFATLLANDTDPAGDTLEVVEVGQPSQGSIDCPASADYCILQPPWSSFRGFVTMSYTITDGHGEFDSATITVEYY